jgi:hypothetical protein
MNLLNYMVLHPDDRNLKNCQIGSLKSNKAEYMVFFAGELPKLHQERRDMSFKCIDTHL